MKWLEAKFSADGPWLPCLRIGRMLIVVNRNGVAQLEQRPAAVAIRSPRAHSRAGSPRSSAPSLAHA